MKPKPTRLLGLSTLISLAIHAAAGVVVASLPWTCMVESVGSNELDVDLDAPRLAPPIRVTGVDEHGRGTGESGVEGRAGKLGARGGAAQIGAAQPALGRDPAEQQRGVAEEAQELQRELAPIEAQSARTAVPAVKGVQGQKAQPAQLAHSPQAEQLNREERAAQPAQEEQRAQLEQLLQQPAPAGEAKSAVEGAKAGAAEPRPPRAAEPGSEAVVGKDDGVESDEQGDLPQHRRVERKPTAAVTAEAAGGLHAVEPKSGGPALAAREPKPAQSASVARRARPATAAQRALQRLFADTEVKAAAPPVAEVAEVKASRAQREQLNRHAQKAQREREARAEKWLADMNAAARAHRSSSESSTEGAGGWGSGPGAGRRGDGGGAGRAPGYGLHFYLAGRPVKGDRVVRPPEAIEVPRAHCKGIRLDTTPATVRMLVIKDGKVAVPYLKHSSGSREFDRCALRHARSIRFRPGHDGAGVPLDVWIEVRVEPSALSKLADGK